MPFELTYADDNNQFLYYNKAHQDPDTMFAKRVPPQSSTRMPTVHGSLPPARMKNVEWIIGTLRNGNQEYVRTIRSRFSCRCHQHPQLPSNVLS